MKKQHFIVALFFYSIAVFYLAATTPISPHEAKLLYTSQDVVSTLMQWGQHLVPGFLGLRLFFLLFGFLTIGLFYYLSKHYFPKNDDAYLATFIFMFLPGILTASVLANAAIVVLPLVLLFVILYEKGYFVPLLFIMLLLFFVHESSIVFFIALFLYGVMYQDKKLVFSSFLFFAAFVYFSKGITIGGRPTGHFAEIFGLYATIFSPLMFLYFVYAMYRTLLRGKQTLLWYISFTALAFSLLLSIRQRVAIADFAPYVMIAVIVMLDVYNQSVRVRLPAFQKYYKRGFYVVVLFLSLTVSTIVFHKLLYYVTPNPKKHFAHRLYAPYMMAEKLKSEGKNCYEGSNRRYYYQLKYYQMLPCPNP